MIGMSDKTISKWENGNSQPDTSMLIPLCKALDISVNELLSCERISPEDYSKKAEETIMTLMKENEQQKKGSKFTRLIGVVLLIIGVFLLLVTTKDGCAGLVRYFYYFIDIPSIVFVVLFVVGIILISGERSRDGILLLVCKTILPVGAVISLASAILMLRMLDDPSTIGANLNVVILAFLYTCIIKIIAELLILKARDK